MQALQRETKAPYRSLCALTGLSYSTLMRWQSRLRRDEKPIKVPGPKKLLAPDWGRLWDEISWLRHGRARTAGTGALYRKARLQISRRELQRCVKEYRRQLHRREREEMGRVRWLVPGAVWSMDDTEKPRIGKVHLVQDAASQYKLTLLPMASIPGKEVSKNLEKLIEHHGPPLVLKRDNGSNLNHKAVEEVLERYLVVPLNSPPRYPRYNGQIERGQREIGESLSGLPKKSLASQPQRRTWARLMAENLNHRPRPGLNGRTSCAVFGGGREMMKRYNRHRRKKALAQIVKLFLDNLKTAGRLSKRGINTAWRRAVETWLLQEGIIAIQQGKSVTQFSSLLVS